VTDRTPLVTVLLAAHDAQAYLRDAVDSVLGQTLGDFELLVVDDASADATPAILAGVADPRLVVVRNERRSGLAASLNRGLDAARGRWVARLDADDVALPARLERQVAAVTAEPCAVLGSAVADMDEHGVVQRVHSVPTSDAAVRWHALFSSPFYHPTVLVDRGFLDGHGLRYDTSLAESEDYDLWSRVLEVGTGRNLDEPLVLYRVHAAQASQRRRALQRDLQQRVAFRAMSRLAPELSDAESDLAWRLGVGEPIAPEQLGAALEAFGRLVESFERAHPGDAVAARHAAARALALAARDRRGATGALVSTALRLDPALALHAVRRAAERRRVRQRLLRTPAPAPGAPVRLAFVLPEPTPYRNPMLDRLADRPEVELTALYAGASVQRRDWSLELRHRAVVLEGRRAPGAKRVLRHDYPLSLGVFAALREAQPEVVVVSGWSTFASQAAIAWCRSHGMPYVLLVESNDRDARPGWRRAVKGTLVPSLVRGAAHVLVVGKLAQESMLARGADPEQIDVFADTIDVAALGRQVDELARRREELRAEAGLDRDDVAVLSVARLAAEKGLDTLVRAAAEAGDQRLVVVLAGSGPERDRLVELARREAVRLVVLPHLEWERIAERYVIADVFALLSTHEPWGVVVNEAAAAGLPLLLSDRVGAAHDLLGDGRNGILVPAGDHTAAAEALRTLAADTGRRREMGSASRELVADWGYEPSIETLIRVVRRVAGRS
jgi:glycosyltransferase involved in cell wall biosynthesis